MFRLTRSHLQPIGLDLGSDSIKMLQLEVVGNGMSVTAAAQQALPGNTSALPPDQRIAQAIDVVRHLMRQAPFRGKHVVTALPRSMVHVKNLRLPQIPAAELAAAVQFEAKNLFAFDTDDAQVHFMCAGEVRQGGDFRNEVIVVAARNSEVDGYLEQLHRAGVIVDSLDIEPCALYRGIERFIRRRADEQDVHVLVEVGASRSHVVIGKGRDINFSKQIEMGGRQLSEAVSRKLGISLEEAQSLRRRLAESGEAPDAAAKRDPVRQAVNDATRSMMEELGREISLCLRYHSVTFRGHRPSRLRLIGGEACDPQIRTLLAAQLTLPVEIGKPLYSVNTAKMNPADRRGQMCEWSMAFGLSMKMTQGTFAPRDGKPRDPNAPREDIGPDAVAVDPAAKAAEPAIHGTPAHPAAAPIAASAATPVTPAAAPSSIVAPPRRAIPAAAAHDADNQRLPTPLKRGRESLIPNLPALPPLGDVSHA